MTTKISLSQQVEAVRFAETRQRTLAGGGTVRGMRGESVEQFDLERLSAAARTLEWLQQNEAEIRKLLAIEPERRALLWSHMGEVAALLDKVAAGPAGEEGQS